MKALSYMVSAALILLMPSCSGNGVGTDSRALMTDTISVADSIDYSGSTAEITISGQYPSAGAVHLVDSIRQWLADCLSWGTFTTDEPLIHASRQEIANGRRLIDHVSTKLRAVAKRDFIFLAADSIKVGYEYQINFAPEFESDSLLTYVYNTYCYLGGAHGSAISRAATFVVSTGRRLTYENAFKPGCRQEIIALVRNAIWRQYFRPTLAGEGAPATLKESLLIEPEAMDLPICGPEFGEKGVTFTYGQYEIAPYSAGMPACTLPYSEISSLLNPDVLPLIPAEKQ